MSTIRYVPDDRQGRLRKAGRKDLTPQQVKKLGRWAVKRLKYKTLSGVADRRPGPVRVLERLARTGHRPEPRVLDLLLDKLQAAEDSLLVRTEFGDAIEPMMAWFEEPDAQAVWRTHSGWVHPAKGLAAHPNLSASTFSRLLERYDPRVGLILSNRNDLLGYPRCVATLVEKGSVLVQKNVLIQIPAPQQVTLVAWVCNHDPGQALSMARKAILDGAEPNLARPLLQATCFEVRQAALRLIAR